MSHATHVSNAILSCICATAFIAAPASASLTLDQANAPSTGYISSSAGFVQQQVTVGLAGTLAGFAVMSFAQDDLVNYSFFIARGSAWNTSAHVFDLTGFSSLNNAANAWVFIDTSAANINFNAGDTFVIGWTSSGGSGRLASSGNTYSGGGFWNNQNGFTKNSIDLGFQTYVGSVPAPGALALLGAAGLVGARRRRA